MIRVIATIAALVLAAIALASPAHAGTGTINVTPQSPGGSSSNTNPVFVVLFPPDGLATASLGSRGNVTTFSGLEPGTYNLLLQDIGGILNRPTFRGEATVTLGEGETVDITVTLFAVPFPVVDAVPF